MVSGYGASWRLEPSLTFLPWSPRNHQVCQTWVLILGPPLSEWLYSDSSSGHKPHRVTGALREGSGPVLSLDSGVRNSSGDRWLALG